jgi:hypothetical protein
MQRGWDQVLLPQGCPAPGLHISSETKVREAQQFMGKHTVFLSPFSQGWGREGKGWQRWLLTFGGRGRCQDNMV